MLHMSLPAIETQDLIQLTAHEMSVQFYQEQGLTSIEISSMLNLSPLTIAFYEMTLKRKEAFKKCANLDIMTALQPTPIHDNDLDDIA